LVPVISVTVLAFRAFLVSAEPNWKIALRLALILPGSYVASSARAAKPQAIIMATIASPSKRFMVFPELYRLILHLAKALLRIHRSVLCGFLVPLAGFRRIGSDAPHILLPKHGWVVGLSQQECSAGLLRVRGPFQQQSGGREVAYRDQTLGPLQQGRQFVGSKSFCGRSRGGWKIGGGRRKSGGRGKGSDGGWSGRRGGRRRSDGRGRQTDFRLVLTGGSKGRGDFVACRPALCGW